MKIAVIGNFLPRRCGIATFTNNFVQSVLQAGKLNNEQPDIFVVAMNDPDQTYAYPDIVTHTIRQQEPEDYLTAADYINASGADICVLQHEFGIYGGDGGVYVLALVQKLKMPLVVTFHTVLKTPSFHEKNIVRKLGETARQLVVMSKMAVTFLTGIYRIPPQKIQVIHHGVPDFSHVEKDDAPKLHFEGRTLLSTFGFLGRSKGIETVINALPSVVGKHPEVLYAVVGNTHPNVVKHAGEEYRNSLKQLVSKHHLENNVVFIDEFLPENELEKYLQHVDIYVTPYLNEAQITSGTLCYAIGSGTCVVSTPYWHAQELLANGRGELFGFGNTGQLADIINNLLDNPEHLQQMKQKARTFGKKMYWKFIGQQYLHMMQRVAETDALLLRKFIVNNISALPAFSLEHIKRLTDDTGIIEHANYHIPNFKEGYCIDDNARALILALMVHELNLDKDALQLADKYLRYIKLMQREDGFFHNDYSYDRRFLDEIGSEDAFGRTIWAMGYMIHQAPTDAHLQFAKDIFFRSFQHMENIHSLRAMSNIIMGLHHFLKRYPDNESVLKVLRTLTHRIKEHFYSEADLQWKWFEPILCYDNALLPLALWLSYGVTQDAETLRIAEETTQFIESHTKVDDHITLVGNNTWSKKGEAKSVYGQQPINAMAMVMMYQQAYNITGNKEYYKNMYLAFSWFTGNNDLFIPLFDEETGGCCDGIEKHGVNRNQGAESNIAYQLSYLTVMNAAREEEKKQVVHEKRHHKVSLTFIE